MQKDTLIKEANEKCNWIFPRTSRGSFSAVSTPIFVTKYSFCSIFQALQDLQTFAPFQSQNFSKICARFRRMKNENSLAEWKMNPFSAWFWWNFGGISRKFRRKCQNTTRTREILQNFRYIDIFHYNDILIFWDYFVEWKWPKSLFATQVGLR